MKSTLKLVSVMLAVFSLVACSNDRMAVAEQRMAEIRATNAQPVEPLPEPEIIEDFSYTAADVRDPFVPPSALTMQMQQAVQSGVKPDVNRMREPLEEFELTELIYRGSVVAPGGQLYGLVQLPNGYIQEVKVGQYMGKSDGKILEITPTQINLEEIIPDARLGFVNKQTALITP